MKTEMKEFLDESLKLLMKPGIYYRQNLEGYSYVWEGLICHGVHTPAGQDQGQTGGRYYHH